MSGVVLRCPQCGTTRSDSGECQACHEAQVRYFCTNHSPGRWLEAAACSQCGARFGEPVRPAGTPPAAAPPMPARRGATTGAARTDGTFEPRRRRTAPVEDSPGGTARPRGPVPGETGATGAIGASPRPAPPVRTAPDRDPAVDEPGTGYGTGAPSNWRDLLMAVARAHQRRAAEAGARETVVVRRRRGGGCFSRLLLLVVFAFVSMLMFGGGLLGVFSPW